ncbi:hypothetical protein [Streptomyces kebangsaanensis]|uniref:hypothetical protein n=1 Tax=Streptomyces kebangsaanensis TaxID=864058 RepID=UPI00093BF6DE|nr:hypothetical protein [Streptomyces kebangsaanensis]
MTSTVPLSADSARALAGLLSDLINYFDGLDDDTAETLEEHFDIAQADDWIVWALTSHRETLIDALRQAPHTS